MRYDAAPLQGVTTYVYRSVHHRLFGGADRYFTPFYSPTREHLFTPREYRELCPEHNAGVPVVPQILTHSAEDFLWAAGALRGMGYPEVNLNLGCPFGTVTAKGKGCGFLARPAELDAFFDTVFSRLPDGVRVSVKTRLGLREEAEFGPLLEIYNRYPIAELILHPRLQRDLYKHPVRIGAFAAALERCALPVCYNGDLVTPGDCAAFSARFPRVDAVMAGRGLAADPALFRKLRGGPGAAAEELRELTQTLYQTYCRDFNSRANAAQRMKETWFYLIHLFADDGRWADRLRRAASPPEYERLEAAVYRDLPLLEEARGDF